MLVLMRMGFSMGREEAVRRPGVLQGVPLPPTKTPPALMLVLMRMGLSP
jgi:hypothetical protein